MEKIYKKIIKAIYKTTRNKKEAGDLIVKWVLIFEESNVKGFNRQEFLDYCVEESKKWK